MFGLDDLRDIQSCEKVDVHMEDGSLAVGFKILSEPLQVFLNQETKLVADSSFGYLTMKPEFLDEANLILKRRVALLDFQVIENTAELNLYGLPVRSFPVYHGGDYISLGFSIGMQYSYVYAYIIPQGCIILQSPYIHCGDEYNVCPTSKARQESWCTYRMLK